MSSPKRPTPAQRQVIVQTGLGNLSRMVTKSRTYYYFRHGGSWQDSTVENVRLGGWLSWVGNRAVLTDSGLELFAKERE